MNADFCVCINSGRFDVVLDWFTTISCAKQFTEIVNKIMIINFFILLSPFNLNYQVDIVALFQVFVAVQIYSASAQNLISPAVPVSEAEEGAVLREVTKYL